MTYAIPSALQEFGAESRREAASREAANKAELRAKLAGLPQPENEYEVSIPELPDMEEKAEGIEEDAADLAIRRKNEAVAREAAELKKRSQASLHSSALPALICSSNLTHCDCMNVKKGLLQ